MNRFNIGIFWSMRSMKLKRFRVKWEYESIFSHYSMQISLWNGGGGKEIPKSNLKCIMLTLIKSWLRTCAIRCMLWMKMHISCISKSTDITMDINNTLLLNRVIYKRTLFRIGWRFNPYTWNCELFSMRWWWWWWCYVKKK